LEDMEIEELQMQLSSTARTRYISFSIFALVAIYGDIVLFKVPFLSYFICPLVLLGLICISLFQRKGLIHSFSQCLIGPPAALLITILFTSPLSTFHDHWILREVREWGNELRQQKRLSGSYPVLEKKFFHGYRAVLINQEPTGPALIHVDLFGQTRQFYSVSDDLFLERREM